MNSTLDDLQQPSGSFRYRPVRAAEDLRILLLESLGVLVSPAVLFWVLRLRGMAPVQQPDPSMHSTFIFSPDMLSSRFGSAIQPEVVADSARVGFLLPARLMYLLFGAVPGFFVFRYLLALVAIVPVYLLLRRLYGRWAGWVGIVVVMSSAVFVATWGSDYSSSAAMSYLLGGQAAVGLSLEDRRWSKPWLIGAATLFTMSIWTNGICLFVVVPTFVAYLGLRFLKDRRLLGWDILIAFAVAAMTTLILLLFSKLLLGYWDFISVTMRSSRTVSAVAIANWHSASWAWAPYDLYLLVPPAILVAFCVVFARRTGWQDSVLLVGVSGSLQLLLFAYLQFFSHYWVLETPLFSCFLWGATNLMLALLVSEIMKDWIGSPRVHLPTGSILGMARSSVPALILIAVPLIYEASPHAPRLTWSPWGYVLGVAVIAAAGVGRLILGPSRIVGHRSHRTSGGWRGPIATVAVVLLSGAALILTVAPEVAHRPPPNTSTHNPHADYSSVLGGHYASYLEAYRVLSELPSFVGKPSYPHEQLVLWIGPGLRVLPDFWGPIGLFGSGPNVLPGTYPSFDSKDQARLNAHRAGQVLLMSSDGGGFDQAVRSLSAYGPQVARKAVLGSSAYHLHVWLVDLKRYAEPRPAAAG